MAESHAISPVPGTSVIFLWVDGRGRFAGFREGTPLWTESEAGCEFSESRAEFIRRDWETYESWKRLCRERFLICWYFVMTQRELRRLGYPHDPVIEMIEALWMMMPISSRTSEPVSMSWALESIVTLPAMVRTKMTIAWPLDHLQRGEPARRDHLLEWYR